jgi:hypothetical protein
VQGTGGTTSVTVVDFTFTPSNFDPVALEPSVTPTAVTLDCGTSTFDSKTLAFGNWCGQAPTPVIVPQASGPDLVVIPIAQLSVASGATLKLTGDKPVVFAVFGDTTIAGTVDASATKATPGAGGNVSCSVGAGDPGDNGVVGSGTGGPGGGGGGGGAFGSPGGAGGTTDNNQVSKGGVASAAEGTPELVPLRGGCAGGRGGDGTKASAAPGGGGGGAVEISAAGTLSISGVVSAGGGGGVNGAEGNGGGGGGSGGAILLEGETVSIAGSAWITANGGGGAAGNPYLNTSGSDGADGSKNSGSQASGGSGNSGSGNGGKGAASAGAAQNGADATGPYGSRGGGGGGGGVGRVRVHSPNACPLGSASPAATTACP